MAKLRYALAAIFFAASVGCLALWWRSMTTRDILAGPSFLVPTRAFYFETFDGVISTTFQTEAKSHPAVVRKWSRWYPSYPNRTNPDSEWRRRQIRERAARHGIIGVSDDAACVYFPLWYPALVFALAGVGVLRFRRQFSIRSAIVVVSVVAVLLGIIVAL